MPEPKSFLASVKDEIGDVFADVYDKLAEISSDTDQLGASLKATHRKVWEIVEQRLKESFRNGQKGVERRPHADNDAPRGSEPRSNPFRRKER